MSASFPPESRDSESSRFDAADSRFRARAIAVVLLQAAIVTALWLFGRAFG
jgi:hypothetical protein